MYKEITIHTNVVVFKHLKKIIPVFSEYGIHLYNNVHVI